MGSATERVRSTACPGGPFPTPSSTARIHRAARLGTTWTNPPGTCTRTPSDRRNPWLYHLAFTTSHPSLAMHTKSRRLLRPRETGARPLTTFRTLTHRTLRPARNGLTLRTRHHARIPPSQCSLFSGTSARVLRVEAGFCLFFWTSTLDVQRPDLAWLPPPRDFDNDRTEDEPDYSFAAVIDMIHTFHDIEKPTTMAPSRTATAFDQMRGLQNDRATEFHLAMSPLLGGLIDDVNATLARLVEEQTSGFIPFPMKRFYRTAARSLSAPYTVPPSLTSLTREKSSDHKRRLILLPYSVLTSLESTLAGIGETISWLDWWLSTVSGFREALYPSAQANFERILSSGLKALAFVGSQAVPALANLLLSRQDSLLTEVRSTVLAEELSLLRHSPLPPAAAIFPPTLLDMALNKARTAFNDALVHKALHLPRIPKRPAQGNSRASSANRSADTSGSSPLTPRQQQTPRNNNQASSQAANKPNKTRNQRRPFSQSTGRSGSSGGKGKGSGKRSNWLYRPFWAGRGVPVAPLATVVRDRGGTLGGIRPPRRTPDSIQVSSSPPSQDPRFHSQRTGQIRSALSLSWERSRPWWRKGF